jgi:predicted ATP-dependent serine protease
MTAYQKKYRCKHCGRETSKVDCLCYHCAEKVKLWRTIQKMVLNKKREIERGKQQ